jgi:hypothetical protein
MCVYVEKEQHLNITQERGTFTGINTIYIYVEPYIGIDRDIHNTCISHRRKKAGECVIYVCEYV